MAFLPICRRVFCHWSRLLACRKDARFVLLVFVIQNYDTPGNYESSLASQLPSASFVELLIASSCNAGSSTFYMNPFVTLQHKQ
jgi:hypothetical protein